MLASFVPVWTSCFKIVLLCVFAVVCLLVFLIFFFCIYFIFCLWYSLGKIWAFFSVKSLLPHTSNEKSSSGWPKEQKKKYHVAHVWPWESQWLLYCVQYSHIYKIYANAWTYFHRIVKFVSFFFFFSMHFFLISSMTINDK